MSTVILPPQNRQATVAKLSEFLLSCFPGKPVRVEIDEYKPKRSSEQNRYLRAVEQLIGDHVGYSLDEVHTWLLGSYFGWTDHKVPRTPRNPEGIASVPVRTTTRNAEGKRQVLSTSEFTDFAHHVEKIAAQAGVFVGEKWNDEQLH